MKVKKSLISLLVIMSGILTACGNSISSESPVSSESVSESVSESQSESTSESTSESSSESESESESSSESESGSESSSETPVQAPTYNIIMTAATVPPVLSALESIENTFPTYAYIERGKTYSGIAEVSSFENLGFSTGSNLSSGVTADCLEKVEEKISDLKAAHADAKFNIFTTDYKPWAAVKVASETHLSKENFTVYMVEDGSATYSNVKSKYVDPYSTVAAADAAFLAARTKYSTIFDEAMEDSSVLNGTTYSEVKYNDFVNGYYSTFALATHNNFKLLMQDKNRFDSSTARFEGSLLRKVFGIEENDSAYHANYAFRSISDRYEALSEEQQDTYLTLMFGMLYKLQAKQLLTRTTLDDLTTQVPEKKLVYIGSRVRQSNLNMVASIADFSALPTYDNITAELKQVFLNEADYTLAINYLNNSANYETSWANASNEVLNAIKTAAFNYYVGYTYNLRFTYRLYGEKYDILFKGHPAEVLGTVSTWGGYSVTVSETPYTYNTFMHNMTQMFHNSDSEGKFVGVLPAGVAAENLAYVGKTNIAGQSSSTYTGYDKSAPVLFILHTSNDDIKADGNIKQRYLDGELEWEDGDETITTKFYNIGYRAQTLRDLYHGYAEEATGTEKTLFQALETSWNNKLVTWYTSVINGTGATGLDYTEAAATSIGAPLLVGENLSLMRSEFANEVATAYAAIDMTLYTDAQRDLIASYKDDAIFKIYSTDILSNMKEAKAEFNTIVAAIE